MATGLLSQYWIERRINRINPHSALLTVRKTQLAIALALFLPFGNGATTVHAQEQEVADATLVAREVVGEKGMAATVHPQATKAAVRVLRNGGNAIDAAVAAALTLGVVDSHNSGIGGGCFLLIRLANGETIAIDGRETAPAAASRDMFVIDGQAQPALSQTGPIAIAVPGAIAAYDLALKDYGTQSFQELATPAAELAENGFMIDRVLARNLEQNKATLRQFDGPRAIFFHADDSVFTERDRIKQPHLAETYRMLAEHGAEWFYRGDFARRVAKWMEKNGGLITEQDFAKYRAIKRPPLVTSYRDYEIIGFPPPSSGGVHVAQILGILEQFDLAGIHRENPAQAAHIIAESMELAFADRAHWLGDADFVAVPRGLVSKSYLKSLAGQIDLDSNVAVPGHGTPPDAHGDLFSQRHTTHICVVDPQGNWVGVTATINTSFGSKVIVPGTGVFLNNEMDDFSIQPGVPNAFGLIGAENNAIAPGKRPLSSMSPTLVVKDGEPVLIVGAAGGPKIITQVVLTILRHLEFGMGLGNAVAEPRMHHQWRPDKLVLEDGFPDEIAEALRLMGHQTTEIHQCGVCQAIARNDEGNLVGVSDPRVPGRASGF